MLSSGSLIRIKQYESGEFDYHFSGLMPVSLSRGTYLVQLRGLSEFSAAAEIRARFDRMDRISAVNGSTFYHRSRTSMSHQFGFELFGEKVKDVLIRSVGPGLEYFEMDGCTLNPRLTVSKNGFKRWSNEDWGLGIQTASQMATLMESSGAFPLPGDSEDAVLSLSLASGQYEVDSDRSEDDFGFEIMEVYVGPGTVQ